MEKEATLPVPCEEQEEGPGTCKRGFCKPDDLGSVPVTHANTAMWQIVSVIPGAAGQDESQRSIPQKIPGPLFWSMEPHDNK